MIPPKRARVFTIPASVPFLPTLIEALRDGKLVPGFAPRDQVELSRATIYLPTKRACRMAREALLDALGVDAAVLPRIVPLGSIDEDEFAFADGASAGLDLPPAISGLERQTLLTRLILKWAAAPDVRGTEGATLVATSPSAAFALAGDLARLMDDIATRQVPWEKLDDLVPSELDRYWQHTLEFLRIAREAWPQILTERGAIEPAERRDRLITAEATRLAATSDGPVIAAGSTGSMPATAQLIATIARLRNGAVVLPGLDQHLDDRSWQAIDGADSAPAAGHPQAAMHALLARMEVQRGDVVSLGQSGAREVLVSEALRPAATTDLWPARLADRAIAARIAAGVKDLVLIETANAEEEALAIAVALREAIEQGKRAALVTPDRRLARRVVAALARWRIEADDTAGDPLTATPAGMFARLAAEVALGGLAPVPLLALLKNPLMRLGADAEALSFGISALERAVLRGPRPRAGSAALAHALAATRTEWERLKAGEESDIHASDPRALLTAPGFDAAADVVARLTAALAPLETIMRGQQHSFRALAARHQDVVARLSEHQGIAATHGEDGAALALAFDEIAAQSADADLTIDTGDYTELFAAALGDRTVHRHAVAGARVRIYGLLEARLADTDRVVLGGLVEGVWPPDVGTDPWLSRPMRQTLGLNLPELRIGLTAHDFAQMFGAKEVILTRASKLAGAPTVASRFLQRLAAVAGERWKDVAARGEQYVTWARALDKPATVTPIKRPEPKPPLAARPTSFSVTEIESWLRDPYTIYAKRILRLRPLDPIDTTPGAAERGTAIHEALAEFTLRYADRLPADPLNELLQIGRTHFAPLDDYPEARAFWWPRFERIAGWFVGWEVRRRTTVTTINAEANGKIEFPLGERRFTLRARADRIERLKQGGYAILDYKTGRVPGHDEVKVGLAPQLTLEAAILRNGGFPDIAADATVKELVYVGLKGGDPGGEDKIIMLKDSSPDAEADRALTELKRVALAFEDPEQPYRSLVLTMWKTRYGDYDHLARVKEWSLAADDEEQV
jgi:ATP-dependent helicase/nuclease subunit B